MSDLIDRQAAIDHWRSIIDATDECDRYNMGFVDGLEFCISHLSTMPSAEPERKTGQWLPDNRPGGGFWVCSCCKFPSEAFAANVLYKFCPNCGAWMGGDTE